MGALEDAGGQYLSHAVTVSPAINGLQGNGEPKSRGHSEAEKKATVAEATRFLDSFDYSSIDQAAAIRKRQREDDAQIAAQPDPAERPPRLTGDDLALSAVSAVVWDRLEAHLIAKGLEPYAATFMSSYDCGDK